jgi:hypothetical protein
MRDQTQSENVEYFSYLGRKITSGARCTREVKSRAATVKAALDRKKAFVTSKMSLHLRRKKTVECYIWRTALCGAKTGTFWGVDGKYLESFEMCCWRWMEIN